MAEPNQHQLLANTVSIVAVLLLSSGVLVNTLPLESRRPADAERAAIRHAGRQDVDARLWQDPFTVMQAAKARAGSDAGRCQGAINDVAHHPATLSKLLLRRTKTQAVTVLPVLVPGGPYFEDGESRRRARYAVTSALLNTGWEPADGEKLGYVWTFEGCIDDPWLRWVPDILPWEWFSRTAKGSNREEGLLILWVDDAVVSRHPLRSVSEIVKGLQNGGAHCPSPPPTVAPKAKHEKKFAFRIDQRRDEELNELLTKRLDDKKSHEPPELCPKFKRKGERLQCLVHGGGASDVSEQAEQSWCATRVLGPWTSDGLQGLMRDVGSPPSLATAGQDRIRFYSSAATALVTKDLLPPALPQVDESEIDKTPSQASMKREKKYERVPRQSVMTPEDGYRKVEGDLNERLVRLTTTDDQLVAALIKELTLRLTDPSPFWRLLHRGGEAAALCRTTVVTVSESDTSYPRLFADAFRKSLSDSCQSARLVTKTYLRGLDGVVPDGAGAPAPARPSNGSTAARKEALPGDAPRERADGRSQYDYLRRLAHELADVDVRARREGGSGVRAIGVFGNDVYDKLLILEAMRPQFPKVLYFTSDLDARMAGADVASWTRNLVVASAYGLTLEPELQGAAPPFRDVYQTGLYLSTIAALDPSTRPMPDVKWFAQPQLFAIGRTRAVPLSKGSLDSCPTADKAGIPKSIHNCPNVHGREHLRHFPWPRPAAAWGFVIATSSVALLALLVSENARNGFLALKDRPWAFTGGIAVLGAFVSATTYLIWRDVSSHYGPPFAWAEGVSLWPVVLMRLFVCAVILALLSYAQRRLSSEIAGLSKDFGLNAWPGGMAATPEGATGWRHRIPSLWAFDSSDAEYPENPWLDFVRRMRLRERITRTLLTTLLFVLFSVALLSVDWPQSLHRGVFSAWAGHATLMLVLLGLAALLAVALDSSFMVTRFVERLGRQVETLEIPKSSPGDAWLRLPMDPVVTRLATWLRLAIRLGTAVNPLIYLPFGALLLTLATRAILLEALTLPVVYQVLFAVAALIAVFCAVRLRRGVAELRATIVGKLNDRIDDRLLEADLASIGASGPAAGKPEPVSPSVHAPASGKPKRGSAGDPTPTTGMVSSTWDSLPPRSKAERIKTVRDRILEERSGPLRPFQEDPVVRAILLLLGGAGAITTAQFLFLTGGN